MPVDVIDHHPLVDELFDEHESVFGAAREPYRNHCYRVFNTARELLGADDRNDQMAVAVFFHDVGIWTDGTIDYLAPSIARAAAYLEASGKSEWTSLVSRLIGEHHKVTRCVGNERASIDAFRRADWIDVIWYGRRFGVRRAWLAELRERFPEAGFHKLLLGLGMQRMRTHPLSPLPMLRW